MLIELTGDEVARATRSTIYKLALAQRDGHRNRRQMDPERAMLFTFQGALAELAVSLATGLPWTAERAAFVSDVGDLEIRSRGSDKGRFLLRSYKDTQHDATQKFVFCTVQHGNQVFIDGWQYLGNLARTWTPHHYEGDGYTCFEINPATLHRDIHTALL